MTRDQRTDTLCQLVIFVGLFIGLVVAVVV
ncbi:hypothetical protein MMA231_00936 [Asticcacaulis sp. MM231]